MHQTQVKNVIGVIEDANQMIVHLNHRNAMFVRNDILQKLSDQNVLEIFEKPN